MLCNRAPAAAARKRALPHRPPKRRHPSTPPPYAPHLHIPQSVREWHRRPVRRRARRGGSVLGQRVALACARLSRRSDGGHVLPRRLQLGVVPGQSVPGALWPRRTR
eukprot:5499097-Prymnesium_polylepis.1